MVIPVEDVESQNKSDSKGGPGPNSTEQEHNNHAKEHAYERHPGVVELVRGPPAGGLGDGGVEAGEVHEGVGGQEEVGGDHGDGVELGEHGEASGHQEDQDVPPVSKDGK